jgi:hypothetical protein
MLCGVLSVEQGGFFFHPTDKDPSVGWKKKPLSGRAFALRQLENGYKVGEKGAFHHH